MSCKTWPGRQNTFYSCNLHVGDIVQTAWPLLRDPQRLGQMRPPRYITYWCLLVQWVCVSPLHSSCTSLAMIPQPVHHVFPVQAPTMSFLERKQQHKSHVVVVLAGIELIFFVVAGTVLCFGFSMWILLIIHECFSCCWTSHPVYKLGGLGQKRPITGQGLASVNGWWAIVLFITSFSWLLFLSLSLFIISF